MNAKNISGTPRTIELRNRQIVVDGKPRLILAGEVHYFRLAASDWANRLDLLQANGLNAVATYIPWIWHETSDESFDLTGQTHPQRNVLGFLDLCAERGLDVIARPGPFIMAELKNEGIPYRLYTAETAVRPISWDSKPVTTSTLDYLAPQFLEATSQWYGAIMPALSTRLAPRGGEIIGVQLDNEIGMLSWVSGSPDLTDVVCEDMREWCRQRYGDAVASERVGADAKDPIAWAKAMRSPQGNALSAHHDLGLYMRVRFKKYVQALREMAEAHGVRDVPFLINLHGTSAGRGRTFPVGISQLYESYSGQEQMTSGSDHYLGELTIANAADLYVCNAFMQSVHGEHQPLTSLEFEAGDGNYADDFGVVHSPEAAAVKTRLCIAQGNRLLNYYLHAGGENPPFPSAGDGVDRIAITGQRHGFAAPVSPEGELRASYAATGAVASSVLGIECLLADSTEEYDDLQLGFVPDHYLTEYRYPAATKRAEQISDLETFRGMGPRDILVRAMLLTGFSFSAVNLQTDAPTAKCLVLCTGRTLSSDVQRRVADFVIDGGKLLLAARLPDRDHDGNRCTILADALGLSDAGYLEDSWKEGKHYCPSVAALDWTAPRPEVRTNVVQLLKSLGTNAFTPLLSEIQSRLPCAAQVTAGNGSAIFLGTDYPADLEFYQSLLRALGVEPRWSLTSDQPGVFCTSTVTADGQRLLHLVNVAPYMVNVRVSHRGQPMFDSKRVQLRARSGVILPVGVTVRGGIIKESTAEIIGYNGKTAVLRPIEERTIVKIKTVRNVNHRLGKVRRHGKTLTLLSRKRAPFTIDLR